MKRIYLCLVLLTALMLCQSALAFDSLPPGERPIPVHVGLFVDDINSIDEETETIKFEATLTVIWTDERLRFNPKDIGANAKIYTDDAAKAVLNTIWKPQIVFEKIRDKPDYSVIFLRITPQGRVTLRKRFSAHVEIILDLHHFPFDEQKMEVTLHPFHYNDTQVKLIPLLSAEGFSTRAHLAEWKVVTTGAMVRNTVDEIEKRPVSQYMLTIHYDRRWPFYIFQLFVPMIIIVLLSFSVFWMTHNPLVNRVAISLTAILTIVVFQWRIVSHLPRVPYLTVTDIFVLFSFIITGLTLVASVAMEKFDERLDQAARTCQILFPIIYLIGLILVAYFLLW